MIECSKEASSQYQGNGTCYGCVGAGENVVLAIFTDDDVDPVTKGLRPTAFPTKRLKREELSVARQQFTAHQTFMDQVVAPKAASGQPLVGVAVGSVASIRKARGPAGFDIRAACVLDRVDPTEHDGHAVLGYCEQQALKVPEKEMSLVRSHIAATLAKIFGGITEPNSCFS